MKIKSRLQSCIIFTILSLSTMNVFAKNRPKFDQDRPIQASNSMRVSMGGSITATFNSVGFAEALVTVHEAHGKVLMQKFVVLDPGKNLLQFQISEIPQGAYFIEVKTEQGTETLTIVVH